MYSNGVHLYSDGVHKYSDSLHVTTTMCFENSNIDVAVKNEQNVQYIFSVNVLSFLKEIISFKKYT